MSVACHEDGPLPESTEVDPEASMTVRRKNLGRSARRRKKKLQEILRAQQALLLGESSSPTVETTVLAVDRDRVWPAVQRMRESNPWSPQDQAQLVVQLGYLPGNAIRITARSSQVPALCQEENDPDTPVAIQLYPLVYRQEYAGGKAEGRKFKGRKRVASTSSDGPVAEDGTNREDDESSLLVEPFPTQFWLTHPLLRTFISRLELEGFGVRLEQKLAASPDLLASMKRAHAEYAKERMELLVDADWDMIRSRNWESAFSDKRGVAGSRNFASVKCLHAHAAHYLSNCRGSQDNVVGRMVMEAVEELYNNASWEVAPKA